MSELSDIIDAMRANQAATGVFSFPIPNAVFETPISSVRRSTINKAAPRISEQQVQIAAGGAVLGFGYGRCRVGFKVLFPVVDANGGLLVPAFIGKGPIDAIETVEMDNTALLSGVTHTDYTGTTTQVVDTSLQAAWLLQNVGYADTMPGVAYTVLHLPSGPGFRFGNFTAVARMLKVYDPRLDSTNGGSGPQRLNDQLTWAWSQNPVLALAHFLTTPGFGPEETLEWSSVITAANIADQQLTLGAVTQTRRQIGIFFDQQQSVDAIEATLRSYAGVFIVREDNLVRFVADAVASIVYTFTNAAPSNYLLDSLDISQRNRGNSPTVVTIKWTDTAQSPWGTQEVTVKADGVDSGAVPWVESIIDWPGCQSAGMAYREGVRRINEFNLSDTTVNLIGTDEALKLRRGDVVGITDSEGFGNKPYRLTDVFAIAPGRWGIGTTEYQDGLYSDTVYTGPVIEDTIFPAPTNPPQVTGLTVVEEPYIEQYKVTATQARLEWNRPVWPFLHSYWVVGSINGIKQFDISVLPGNVYIFSEEVTFDVLALPGGVDRLVMTDGTSHLQIVPGIPVVISTPDNGKDQAVTPKLRPGELYSFGVYVRSSVATGLPVYIGLRPVGRSNPPSDVAALYGFSVGGTVFLSWPEAIDDDQIHIQYELRYGPTGGTWESAILIQRIKALHYAVPGIPIGTWRFWIKAIDSIAQYSVNAVYRDLTVESLGDFSQTDVVLIDASMVNLASVDVATQADPAWVSDNGDGMGYGHVDTDNTTGAWIDANVLSGTLFVMPNTLGNSSWTSEIYDHGAIISASWAAELPYRQLVGTADFNLYLSDGLDSPMTWTAYPGGIAVGVGARYAYLELTNGVSGDVFAVDGYGAMQIIEAGAAPLRPSAVTTEALTADTSVTVVIEGIEYKLLAKA